MYDVEALSPHARRVFLIHWNRSGGYDLRQLDFLTKKLTPTRLDDPDEKMIGQATTAVGTRDGHWLLTLYVKPDARHTFIHALDLRSGIAHCIDLPLVANFATAGALALSPDEQALYVASGYAGRVVTVDLAKLEVTRVVRFPGVRTNNVDMSVGPSAAVTANGRMLAFSAGRSVALYDTAFGVVRASTTFNTQVTGLGFGPSGRRLLVLERHGPPAFLAAATGERR
jgi:hypothetical protein